MPVYPNTEEESTPSINEQIRSTPAVVDAGSPESPYRERITTHAPPLRSHESSGHTMSTQTLVMTTEVISRTIVPNNDDDATNHVQQQDPQHIRDTFNIALGRAPGGPGGPGGPNRPRGPNDPYGGPDPVPPTHLIPIQPAGDLKPVGIPPLIFDGDRTHADAFLQEL